MNKYYDIKKNLIYYFFFISILTVFFLFIKHEASTDSSISGWLINYQGGFTRRGLIGNILFEIGLLFNIHIRFLVFILQSFFYLLFYFLLFNYIKNLKINYFLLLAIFSPLFIFYPVAELESLGRQEILLLLIFITFCMNLERYEVKTFNLYFIFILPLMALVWEGIIFFYSFFISIYMIKYKGKKNLIFIYNTFLLLVPTLFIIFLINYFKHTTLDYKEMCKSLELFYNQKCYMALTYTASSLKGNIGEVKSLFSFSNLFRFISIFILGFLPLIILSYSSMFKSNKVFILFFKNMSFLKLFAIMLLPTFILYCIAIDWGRWLHITYSMSIIFFIFCLKNNIIYLNFNLIKKRLNFFIIKRKFPLILLFIIFAFSWNHKTVMHEDIGSIPIYRSVSKVIKWKNIIFYNDMDISRNSKKYISSGEFFKDK